MVKFSKGLYWGNDFYLGGFLSMDHGPWSMVYRHSIKKLGICTNRMHS